MEIAHVECEDSSGRVLLSSSANYEILGQGLLVQQQCICAEFQCLRHEFVRSASSQVAHTQRIAHTSTIPAARLSLALALSVLNDVLFRAYLPERHDVNGEMSTLWIARPGSLSIRTTFGDATTNSLPSATKPREKPHKTDADMRRTVESVVVASHRKRVQQRRLCLLILPDDHGHAFGNAHTCDVFAVTELEGTLQRRRGLEWHGRGAVRGRIRVFRRRSRVFLRRRRSFPGPVRLLGCASLSQGHIRLFLSYVRVCLRLYARQDCSVAYKRSKACVEANTIREHHPLSTMHEQHTHPHHQQGPSAPPGHPRCPHTAADARGRARST